MGDASTNGELPHSATWEHLDGYPLIHDSVEYIKNNPYGQRTIEISSAAFDKFVKPALPYFETPASYAKPYVVKVDELGNVFLSKFDEKVPVLKSETKDVKSWVIGTIYLPIDKAGEAKSYVLNVYGEEYKKCGGDGIVAGGKALITSYLVVASDILTKVSEFLSAKKEEAKDYTQEAEKQIKQGASEAQKQFNQSTGEFQKQFKQGVNETEKQVKHGTNEAEKKVKNAANETEKQANSTYNATVTQSQ